MKRVGIGLLGILFGVAILAQSVVKSAQAQSLIPQKLAAGCGPELKKFCAKITPGEGRIVSCLYSHGDKVSGRCAFAVYDAMEQFDAIMDALVYLARNTSCRSDINQYCSNVPAGGGALYRCVRKHKATLTKECREVLPRAEAMLKRAGLIPSK